jgi:hypothetical protein
MTELESPEEFASALAASMDVLGGGVWSPSVSATRETIELILTRDAALATRRTALDEAAEEIAHLCGCSTWDYPAQLVRWVADLKAERDVLRSELSGAARALEQADAWIGGFAGHVRSARAALAFGTQPSSGVNDADVRFLAEAISARDSTIRAAVLEEAARTCSDLSRNAYRHAPDITAETAAHECADAIRALATKGPTR